MKQIWAIKISAGKDCDRTVSGDYHFACSLANSLRKLGITVYIDFTDDWATAHGENVILVLRGLVGGIVPDNKEGILYIMWNISHPELVSAEEYNSYDLVCVSSVKYAEELKQQLTAPVIALLQCTDTSIFHPPVTNIDTYDSDYVFIGNSRGAHRSSVENAVTAQLPLKLWGNNWEPFIEQLEKYLVSPSIPNDQIPDVFYHAKATLNDHWDDMLEYNFINNRIFDALACGIPIITDYHEELHQLFPNEILYYKDYDEFLACTQSLEQHYDTIKERIRALWPVIHSKYSFDSRAAALQALADVLLTPEEE